MGEGWRPYDARYQDGSPAEGWTVEARDILLLGHYERDKRGGHHRGGGRIGPGVGRKRGASGGERPTESISCLCRFPLLVLSFGYCFDYYKTHLFEGNRLSAVERGERDTPQPEARPPEARRRRSSVLLLSGPGRVYLPQTHGHAASLSPVDPGRSSLDPPRAAQAFRQQYTERLTRHAPTCPSISSGQT